MSKIILYGGTPEARSELAEKLAKNSPKHRVVYGWDGAAGSGIESNTIVTTGLMPPFELPLDCCVVGVGAKGCGDCLDDCLPF